MPRFLSATNRALRHYSISTIPDIARRLRRFGDVSLADDFEQFCEMIAGGYRGGLTHNYGHISIGGAVPLPDRVDDYMDLGIVASLVMNEGGEITLQLDFVDNQVRHAEQDIEELESILNRIWAVVLEELDAVAHRDDYRRDRDTITREEEQFADHFDEPATSGEAQSWYTGAHNTSGSARGRSQSGLDDDE